MILRLAFFTHYTAMYGANQSLIALVDGLAPYGVVPHVVAPNQGPLTDILASRGVPVFITPIQCWFGERSNYSGNLYKRWINILRIRRDTFNRLYLNMRLMPALIQQLNQWHIDILHTNTSMIPIGAWIARHISRPHVWHMREFMPHALGLYPDWGWTITRRTIRRANAVIAVSRASKEFFVGKCYQNAHVIYNGVATTADFDRLREISCSHNLPRVGKKFTLAIVGHIQKLKGQTEAICALSVLVRASRNIRLLVVGTGDIAPLTRLATELGVKDYVEFWGHVNDPWPAYLAADAVLMCSHAEAMGRVTAEAMASCRPVVGLAMGGTVELIEHKHTGLLYLGGPNELAASIDQLIQNPEWARELGMNGWRVARTRYTTEIYSKKVYDVLSNILFLK